MNNVLANDSSDALMFGEYSYSEGNLELNDSGNIVPFEVNAGGITKTIGYIEIGED